MIILAAIALFLVFYLINPGFASSGNLLSMTKALVPYAILSLGVTFVIATGGIDLSIGTVCFGSAVLAGALCKTGVTAEEGTLWLTIPIILSVGVIFGLINGFLVAKCRLQAFIATLITMTAYRGVAYIITDGRPISRLAESATSGDFFFKAMGKGNLLIFETIKIPIPALILILAFVVVWFVLTKTTFGRRIYATGSNAKCAKLVGVDTAKIKMACYGISGFLASLAGLLMCSRLNAAQPTFGDGYELDAIAATALGGTSMSGGRGKITGTIAGVLIIAVLNNGMNIMNISSYYQQVVKAVVILVAVLSDRKR